MSGYSEAVNDTPLIDVINNEYELYDQMTEMFDQWVQKSDTIDESERIRRALLFSQHAARVSRRQYGAYSKAEVQEAARDILSQYPEHEKYYLENARIRASAPVVPAPPLDQGAIEHAKKYEELARKVGIEGLKKLIPASPEKIRHSLEHGDPHLNWIPLRKWDAASYFIREPGISLSEKVCLLKHVARWHYL